MNNKRILICGIDGYLGFSLCKYLLEQGCIVWGIDNLNRRKWVKEIGSDSVTPITHYLERQYIIRKKGFNTKFILGDLQNYDVVHNTIEEFKPDTIYHLGEQASAPFSMIDIQHATMTQVNNVTSTLNLLFAVRDIDPNIHIIKIATAGEWGTPNIQIPEGWLDIEYKGRKDTLPFPKVPASLYHISKSQDTLNIEFACRMWNLNITNVFQGVLHGLSIPATKLKGSDLHTRFDIDACFPSGIKITCNPQIKVIENVNVGDKVLTHKGNFKRVLRKFQRKYSGEMIDFEIKDKQNNFSVTPNHPLLVVKKKGKFLEEPSWILAGEINNWFESIEKTNKQKKDLYKKVMELREKGHSGKEIEKITGAKWSLIDSWVYHKQKPRNSIEERNGFYLVFPVLKETKDIEFIETKKYNFWKKTNENGNGYRNVNNNILVKIKRTKKSYYTGMVFNLEIEDDHSYTANTIAAHNCFGTVANRMCAQAIIKEPLTVYGIGGQTRGFLTLRDSIKCLTLLMEKPAKGLRIINQFAELWSIASLAGKIAEIGSKRFGWDLEIRRYENPRIEKESHFYQVERKKLTALGFRPSLKLEEEIELTLTTLLPYREKIESLREQLIPKVQWSGKKEKIKEMPSIEETIE